MTLFGRTRRSCGATARKCEAAPVILNETKDLCFQQGSLPSSGRLWDGATAGAAGWAGSDGGRRWRRPPHWFASASYFFDLGLAASNFSLRAFPSVSASGLGASSLLWSKALMSCSIPVAPITSATSTTQCQPIRRPCFRPTSRCFPPQLLAAKRRQEPRHGQYDNKIPRKTAVLLPPHAGHFSPRYWGSQACL